MLYYKKKKKEKKLFNAGTRNNTYTFTYNMNCLKKISRNKLGKNPYISI